jgi:hypothetical protein
MDAIETTGVDGLALKTCDLSGIMYCPTITFDVILTSRHQIQHNWSSLPSAPKYFLPVHQRNVFIVSTKQGISHPHVEACFIETTCCSPNGGGEQHAFTCEPFHNLIQHNIVTEEGISFSAKRDAPEGVLDFFAS